MKKRILSLLLCVAMLLTLLPQTALFASAATSGTCGTNLRWSYNSSTYTLTITGTGAMTNWNDYSDVPWYSYRRSIKSVSLPDGLTSIGDWAFEGCAGLTGITIPDSVTSIGDLAFSHCTGLTAITIPDSVTSIGNSAFGSCTGLTAIAIPDSVTSIGCAAFPGCTGLTSITIPDSVTSIGDDAFGGCTGLTSITVAEGNPVYDSRNNCNAIIETATNTMIAGCKNTVIPSGVTSIGNYAFYGCTGLTAISIPDSVTSIGDGAFWCCTGLTSITIPSGVTSIGWEAFYGCTGLTSIVILNSNCTICDSSSTLGDRSITTVYGYEGSTAQTYAEKYGYDFVALTVPPADVGYRLRAYSQAGSFSTHEGHDFYFDVRLYNNGEVVQNWSTPALTVSNRDVLWATIGGKHDFFYRIHVTTNDVGTTNIVVSDSTSGASVTIPFTVYEDYDGVNSFLLNEVPCFYPSPSYDNDILTNFYNRNGLYIKDLQYKERDGKYRVTCTAYNQGYSHGAVDIYDANGNWIGSEKIDKFSDIQSIYDIGDYIGRMITASDGLIAYTSEAIGEKTELDFEVPRGGYFTISNNISASTGAFIYNLSDYYILGCSTILSLASKDLETISSSYSESIEEEIKFNKALKDAVKKEMESVIKKIGEDTMTKQMAAESIKDIAIGFADATVGLLDWEELLKAAAGIAEETVIKLFGPAGWGIETLFNTSKYGNYVIQATEIAGNLKSIPICVHTPHTGSITINGVSVDGADSIPENALLQVFRVYDADELVWFEEKEDTLANNDYELYNICLVKGDETVSTDGNVTVKIKIPEGHGENLLLYRQEPDGSWTSLRYTVQGEYLLFYTNHFSKYVIFYPKAQFTDCGGKMSNCPSAKYTDVPAYGSWAHAGIDFCIERGLMGSTKTDRLTFEPNTKVSRAMVASILYRMAGSPAVEYKATFTDVPADKWFTSAIEWCAQNGLASGKANGKFDPNGNVTRQELAVFMMKMAEYLGKDTSGRADLGIFADAAKVPAWAKTYAQWAVSAGLISGKANGGKTYLAPTDNATRAEFASIIMRFVQNIAEAK